MPRYIAITKERVEELRSYTKEQLEVLAEDEFLDLVEETFEGLMTVKAKADALDKQVKMLKAAGLDRLMAEFEGKVVALGQIVMQQVETRPRVNYGKLIKLLIETRPELESVIADLTPQAMGNPGTQLMKHRKKDEPKKWKELEHVDPRGRGGALPKLQMDPRLIEQALVAASAKMDRLVAKWSEL